MNNSEGLLKKRIDEWLIDASGEDMVYAAVILKWLDEARADIESKAEGYYEWSSNRGRVSKPEKWIRLSDVLKWFGSDKK